MALKLSTCKRCRRRMLMKNPEKYCISCQTEIRDKIYRRAVEISDNTATGRYIYRDHKEYLNSHSKEWIEKKVLN